MKRPKSRANHETRANLEKKWVRGLWEVTPEIDGGVQNKGEAQEKAEEGSGELMEMIEMF